MGAVLTAAGLLGRLSHMVLCLKVTDLNGKHSLGTAHSVREH